MGTNLPALQLPSALAIACGKDLSCALLEPGALRCWGFNASGQLGLGDTSVSSGKPGMANLDLGSDFGLIGSIATGRQHACAISSGTVKCWGANSTGALGLGDTNNRGDKPGQMGDKLPPVLLR
jgi:alpha-tubulin suppressor-like RCC1 family protein